MFHLNHLVAYSLRTAISSLAGNHTMDLLYLLKDNFKNLLFNLLITGRSFEKCLIYQVVRNHKDHDSGEYIRTYYEALNQTLLTPKCRGTASQYILWSRGLCYPVRSSMLKNKRIFSLVISKLMSAFSTVQIDVAKNHIN